jgi:hypothetical protein
LISRSLPLFTLRVIRHEAAEEVSASSGSSSLWVTGGISALEDTPASNNTKSKRMRANMVDSRQNIVSAKRRTPPNRKVFLRNIETIFLTSQV